MWQMMCQPNGFYLQRHTANHLKQPHQRRNVFYSSVTPFSNRLSAGQTVQLRRLHLPSTSHQQRTAPKMYERHRKAIVAF